MIAPTQAGAVSWGWTEILARTETICRILALCVAGIWAYYRYLRGRTFRPRLELTVSGKLHEIEQRNFIVATVGLKNIGLSRLNIKQDGTALMVSTFDGKVEPYFDIPWSAELGFPVFTTHAGIEPNEPVQEKVFFRLPDKQVMARLRLQIMSEGQRWTSDEIVLPETKTEEAEKL